MSKARKIAALARLAALRKDADLTALAGAGAARDAVLAGLSALDGAAESAREAASGPVDAGFLAAQEGFARLVQDRRARINAELAGRTAIWLEQRDKAARSFGQSDVLTRMAATSLAAARARRARGPAG